MATFERAIEDLLRTPGPGVPGNLYPGLPTVRRARGYRLYTVAGRFLDFWQGGGGAILGHVPSGLGRSLKAEIDRGFLAPGPLVEQERLLHTLNELFPGRRFRCFADLHRALQMIHHATGTAPATVLDPGLTGEEAGGDSVGGQELPSPTIHLWRPFLQASGGATFLGTERDFGPGYLLPILPGMHATAALLLGASKKLPELAGDTLRRHEVTLLSHGIKSLIRHLSAASPDSETTPKGADTRRKRGQEIDLWTPGALQSDPALASVWRAKGPYLTPRCSKEDYGAVFDMYLKNGFYVAPAYPGPSVLPHSCSRGEWGAFVKVTAQVAKELSR